MLRKYFINCRKCQCWVSLTLMKCLTIRQETMEPPRDPVSAFSTWGPRNKREQAAVIFPPPLPSPHPSPPHPILGLQECDGISANRQSVPTGDGAAPGGPTLPATVNTRVCPLYQLGSAAVETVCPLESPARRWLLGPLLAALLGLARLPRIGNLGAGLAWGLNTSSRGWEAGCLSSEDVSHSR